MAPNFCAWLKARPASAWPGNAGREAQIVFDPGAGAGLAAERARVEDGDRQSFGGRIDGGGEPRRPAADNRDVIEFLVVVVADHADRVGDRRLRRIAQHPAVRADHQRQVGARGDIARDEIGGVLVGGGIEQMVRLAVARQEILQPRHVAERRRADQHHTAGPALDQIDPAQDQRAHDALAEFGLRDQQRAQLIRRNQQRFDVALGMAVDQREAAGKLADLSEKLPRPLVDDRGDMAKAVALGDRDGAGQHHEHAGTDLAGFEQGVAVPVGAKLPETAHPLDFGIRERRKGLLMARKRDGSCADRRIGRDVCTHLSPPTKETEPCRGRAMPPGERIGDFPLRYWLGFSPLAVSREASAVSEDALGIAAPAGLRLPPLEIFAQRQLQPVAS